MECKEEGCGGQTVARGWCKGHYQRWFRHGDPNKRIYRPRGTPAPLCSVDGCDRTIEGGSAVLCKLHYERQRVTGDVGPAQPKIAARNSGHWYEHEGYLRRSVYRDGVCVGSIMQHVYVMEQRLGRRLVPPENVHHKNGIGHDNDRFCPVCVDVELPQELVAGMLQCASCGTRIKPNLELWLKMQPSGQRVTDLIEYIATYHADAMQALLDRRKDALA